MWLSFFGLDHMPPDGVAGLTIFLALFYAGFYLAWPFYVIALAYWLISVVSLVTTTGGEHGIQRRN